MTPSEAAVAIEAARRGSGGASLRLVAGTEVSEAFGEGAVLRNLRQARGLSVVQVAETLILKAEQVSAIEAMDFDRLPGLGYALGYVRGYAEFIQAPDVEATVDAFRAAWEPVQTSQERARKAVDNTMAVPAMLFVAAGFLLWLVIWAAMHAFSSTPRETVSTPDTAIQDWVATQPALPARGAAVVEPRTVLKASRPVRVELRGADGALVIDRMMRAGEEVSTDGLGRYFVTTPDGGALQAEGYGEVVLVGADGVKIDWWRAPDLSAMADARRAEAALAAKVDEPTAPPATALQATPAPVTAPTPTAPGVGQPAWNPAPPKTQ